MLRLWLVLQESVCSTHPIRVFPTDVVRGAISSHGAISRYCPCQSTFVKISVSALLVHAACNRFQQNRPIRNSTSLSMGQTGLPEIAFMETLGVSKTTSILKL